MMCFLLVSGDVFEWDEYRPITMQMPSPLHIKCWFQRMREHGNYRSPSKSCEIVLAPLMGHL